MELPLVVTASASGQGEQREGDDQGAAHGAGTLAWARWPTLHQELEQKLKTLPAKPGVYIFRDAGGRVLYIGKAKSLRPRVRSYFEGIRKYQQAQLPERIADLEVIVTTNEVEALHLEQNLVKRHRPPFNVKLRDDKSFPYRGDRRGRLPAGHVHARAAPPRCRLLRALREREKVRETLDVLNRVFPYGPARARSRVATPGSRASTTTSSAAWRRASAT